MPKPARHPPSSTKQTPPQVFAPPGAPLTDQMRLRMLHLMLTARLVDEVEQSLKRRGLGEFTMSGAGHEALVGAALAMREQDWLHPHYRDRALLLGRGVATEQFFLDFFARRDSCTAGRQMPLHWNFRRLRILSFSSPVGTNFLQAVGMALSFKERKVSEVVIAAGGDAGTREGELPEAFAAAAQDAAPVVFLIEDNGLGISTRTEGKVFWSLPHGLGREPDGTQWFLGCRVELVDGLDPEAVHAASSSALERARQGAGPTCLVARVVRIGSHSSSDDQRVYRDAKELAAVAAQDPLPRYEKRCLDLGLISAAELGTLKTRLRKEVEESAVRAQAAPPPDPAGARHSAFAPLPAGLPAAQAAPPAPKPKSAGGLTMGQCINLVLEQELRRNDRLWIFGEDIEDPKGDVFSITRGLSKAFGNHRVRNSPLAEASILGLSVGRALAGDLPVPMFQFLDFICPALTQLFNEVVTMYWRTAGEYECPMVILAPYGAYLPGLGPWHSQTNEALFAHIPGLQMAIPSTPGDAAGLLRYSLRCRRPVLFLYPKARLHLAEGTVEAPSAECMTPFGSARLARPGRDVTLVTWGNCVDLAEKAAEKAAQEDLETEILDLRSLVPWDRKAVLESLSRTGRLLVVHEDGRSCGFGAEILAEVAETASDRLQAPPRRITKSDDHNPYEYNLELAILPKQEEILDALRGLTAWRGRPLAARAVAASVQAAAAPAAAPAPAVAAGREARRFVVRVPRQSPTDDDAVLVRWRVKTGDEIQSGAVLAEMEANKGSFELEAPCAGRILSFEAREGERVRTGAPLLALEVGEALPLAAETLQPAPWKEFSFSPAQLQVGALALKSQREIPVASVGNEVDVTGLFEQVEGLRERAQQLFHTQLSTNHLILWCLIQVLKKDRHSGWRGRVDERAEKLLVGPEVNVGFATLGPNNDLYAPVIKRAHLLSFAGLVRRIQELGEAVKTGRISAADLQGASLSLTNIGAFGATAGIPFVIPGQVGMLCACAVQERARRAPRPGAPPALEPRSMLPLLLVFDHRPFNGSHAGTLLKSLKRELENLDLRALLAAEP